MEDIQKYQLERRQIKFGSISINDAHKIYDLAKNLKI